MESGNGENQRQGKATTETVTVRKPKIIARTHASRRENIKKKTMELSTLCDIKACAIVIGTDGGIYTWPENKDEVKEIIDQYRHCDVMPEPGKPNLEAQRKEKVEAAAAVDKTARKASYMRKLEMLSLIESKLEAVDERLESVRAQKNKGGVGTEETVSDFYTPLKGGGSRMNETCNEIDFMGIGGEDGELAEPVVVEPLQSVPWSSRLEVAN